MKKIILCVMALGMASVMAACTPKQAKPETETVLTTETTVTAETTAPPEAKETETATTTAVGTDIEVAAEEAKTVTGEVVDATMNSVIIQTADGERLIFTKEDDVVYDLKNGMVTGDRIVIQYTGEIRGNDTSKTKVLGISNPA
ncbi:MAG: hypothetical protein RSF83_05835 [Hungatella sp.]